MRKIAIFLLLLISSTLSAQTIYYVKTTGSDANNGLSWATAFRTLQHAIRMVNSEVVWVAKGTYYPDEGAGLVNNDRKHSFNMRNHLALYGGFAGNETQLNQRNWEANVTTLSGNIDQQSGNSGNSLHVLLAYDADSTSIVDGFTITGGNANEPGGATSNIYGGGLYNDNDIDYNQGTYWTPNRGPTIVNCHFTNNNAFYGGAIYNCYSSAPHITNCRFTQNTAAGGGAIKTYQGTNAIFTNCTFWRNRAENEGGGVNNTNSTTTFINCSFWGNSAPEGGGIYNADEWYYYNTNLILKNCIIWGNTGGEVVNVNCTPAITYSIIQGGFTGTGNLNTDPLFADASGGNLHLQSNSPAIDAATPWVAPATDLEGHPRPSLCGYDMGAYEFQAAGGARVILYVNASAPAGGDGTSWSHAFTKLQDALDRAATCFITNQIWVAAGTYYPDERGLINSNDREASFYLRNNLAIYGGFTGTETELNQRHSIINITILSGDIDQTENNTGNSYHVVRSVSVNNTAILDGFIVTEGNANGGNKTAGGGMYNVSASPLIANCNFSSNTAYNGGGMYNVSASPTITNCNFINNTCTYTDGGGMLNESSSPIITHCEFMWNHSEYGGGIYNSFNSAPVMSKCSFSENTARQEGGAMYNNSSTPQLVNCIFSLNSANTGGAILNFYSTPTLLHCSFGENTAGYEAGGIYNYFSSPFITNSILWGNNGEIVNYTGSTPVVSFSIVQGGYTGTGNLNADPMFITGLHLRGCSPAINSATGTGAPATDFEDNARPALGGYDMGAFEFRIGGPFSVLYVNASAPAGGDGTSWSHAFTKLQDALAKARTCHSLTQIWVAAGTYYPDEGNGITNNDRYASFELANHIEVYGGFNGTEYSLFDRNLKTNIAVLSGEIDGVAGNAGNSFHVVKTYNADSTAVLDGFTITGGNANDRYTSEHTRGGGLYLQGTPHIVNCIITYNHADSYGGGIANNYSSYPVISNCIFLQNSASASGGGLSNFDYCSPTIIHCSFYGNTARIGGAIHNMNSSPSIINSILWGNSANQIDNASSTAYVKYSIIQDGYYPGAGNLMSDPLFVNAPAGNLRLQPCSPAIDAGNNAMMRSKSDLDGVPRTVVRQTDMGAYEFQGTIIYVKQNATGGNNGTSWANAFTKLQDALAVSTGCSNLVMIWIAQGTYYPDEGKGLANNDRNLSFHLKKHVTVLGGFTGTETYLNERNPFLDKGSTTTTLSGEIDGVAGNAGNSFHVIWSADVDTTAVLDGVTITAGNANGSTPPQNQGGGIYNAPGSGAILYNCKVFANTANLGGGLYNASASPSIINDVFSQNKANTYGAGIYNASSSPAITNVVFWKNTTVGRGGGIYNASSSPSITNCTFWGNAAASGYGGAIYNVSSSAAVTNCILWANAGGQVANSASTPSITYSIVQGGYSGAGNLVADPLFIDAANGNLHFQTHPIMSPTYNAGNNDAVALNYDLGLGNRIAFGIVDIGAYEFNGGGVGGPEPPTKLTLTCPASFTLSSNPDTCGATANYTGTHASTADGGKGPITISYEPAAGAILPLGDNWVTATAKDSVGTTTTCGFWVTVVDSTAPVISTLTATPNTLYPPNHKMQDIHLDYTATDNCSPVVISLSVSSNEAVYTASIGDTGPDWEIINNHLIRLRAERSGSAGDRIYTITVTATDEAGNATIKTVTVSVPHDNRDHVTTTHPVNGKEIQGLTITVVPNPSAGSFTLTIQSPSAQPLTLKVLDAAGRIIEQQTGGIPNSTMYLGAKYRTGVYYVQVVQGDMVQTVKLVKQPQ